MTCFKKPMKPKFCKPMSPERIFDPVNVIYDFKWGYKILSLFAKATSGNINFLRVQVKY